MAFCSGCGTELPSPDADVCTNCGRLVKEQLMLIAHDKLRKRSLWWYLLPIFFGVIGGISIFCSKRK